MTNNVDLKDETPTFGNVLLCVWFKKEKKGGRKKV